MLQYTRRIPEQFAKIGHRRFRRQCIIAALLLLAACGGDPLKLSGVTPSAGFVAADEPHAVAVGRDLLQHGGNAADAAAAMGLTLAVTLPSRASLGGGGACIVRRGRDIDQTGSVFFGKHETPPPPQAIEFMPRAAHDGAAVGVPTLARGLFAVQVKYGKLRWPQLVAPAENMARFGAPVSRALIRDIAAAHADITGPDGKPLAEGDVLPQGDLADTLAELRVQGGGALATGRLAEQIVGGSGGAIDAAALRTVVPIWSAPQSVAFGNNVVYFASGPGGELAEKLWRNVRKEADSGLYAALLRAVDSAPQAGDPAQRAFAIADAGATALALPPERAAPETSDSATSFVVVDGRGDAVACSLTIGRMFGAGRVLGNTGILASLPVPGAVDGVSGAAMLVTNDNTRKLLGAFAGGGDRSGPEAMIQVALNVMAARQSMPDAFATARVYAASPGRFYVEPGIPTGNREATQIATLGAVNAVMCPSGLPVEAPDCVAQTDTRALGVTQSFKSPAPWHYQEPVFPHDAD